MNEKIKKWIYLEKDPLNTLICKIYCNPEELYIALKAKCKNLRMHVYDCNDRQEVWFIICV